MTRKPLRFYVLLAVVCIVVSLIWFVEIEQSIRDSTVLKLAGKTVTVEVDETWQSRELKGPKTYWMSAYPVDELFSGPSEFVIPLSNAEFQDFFIRKKVGEVILDLVYDPANPSNVQLRTEVKEWYGNDGDSRRSIGAALIGLFTSVFILTVAFIAELLHRVDLSIRVNS